MSGQLVLVAHDNEAIRRVIEQLLLGAGFGVRSVADGKAGVAALQDRPTALVLDVAIGEMMAFDVIDVARKQRPRVPVLLVASIYNRTSYKRSPTSLYGADDYVEQHHIVDALVGKLRKLVGPGTLSEAPATVGSAAGAEDRVRAAGEAELHPSALPSGMDPVVRAQRLARLIVSDIALYNGDALQLAQARGSDALQARLRIDLEEGRLLFDMRVSPGIRAGRDFIGEALAELVATSAGDAKVGGEER